MTTCLQSDAAMNQFIEKMKALLKCHRTAIDFDNKFIMSAVFDFNRPVSKRDLYNTGAKLQKKPNI